MANKGFIYQVRLLFMLLVLVLPACSSPQAASGSIQRNGNCPKFHVYNGKKESCTFN
jgi:hypothetical protein